MRRLHILHALLPVEFSKYMGCEPIGRGQTLRFSVLQLVLNTARRELSEYEIGRYLKLTTCI